MEYLMQLDQMQVEQLIREKPFTPTDHYERHTPQKMTYNQDFVIKNVMNQDVYFTRPG
jgi:hypothetical protein